MSTDSRSFDLPDCGATERLGTALGSMLVAGDVVFLDGPLGAGKTTLVRGVSRGLGLTDTREVASPTFAIHNRYEGGRLALDHLDFYRLKAPVDPDREGLDLILDDRSAVICVEWPSRLRPDRLRPTVLVELQSLPQDQRRATVTTDQRRLARLAELRS